MLPRELPAWFFRATMLCLLIAAVWMSGGESPKSFANLFFWYLMPAAPFLLLAMLSFYFPRQLGPLWGAAFGAAIAVGVPLGLLWHASATYHGGGADMGLCLIWMSTPIYLPPAMLTGFFAAKGVAAILR